MESLTIYGVLDTWELASANVLAQNLKSSFILFIYALAYHFKKGGCYFAAFLFDEIVSNISFIDPLTETQYYLLISCIYCSLYWYIEKRNAKPSTIVACGLLILFNSWMAADASINFETETVIYTYHPYIAGALYLFLILTLLPWSRIRRNMVGYYRVAYDMLRYSDLASYICYNCKIYTH